MPTCEKSSKTLRKRRYRPTEKELMAVLKKVRNGMSARKACADAGITDSVFSRWKIKNHPELGHRKTRRWQLKDYMQVLEACERGISQKEACAAINMATSTFSEWFKKYRTKNGYQNRSCI